MQQRMSKLLQNINLCIPERKIVWGLPPQISCCPWLGSKQQTTWSTAPFIYVTWSYQALFTWPLLKNGSQFRQFRKIMPRFSNPIAVHSVHHKSPQLKWHDKIIYDYIITYFLDRSGSFACYLLSLFILCKLSFWYTKLVIFSVMEYFKYSD